MTFKAAQSTAVSVTMSGTQSQAYTFLAGVVATDYLLVTAGISTPTSWPAGADSIQLVTNRPTATITKVVPEKISGNMASVAWVITGVQAGDQIWTTSTATAQRQVTVLCFSNPIFVGGVTVRTVSGKTTTVPGPAAPTAGRTQYTVFLGRTNTTGTPTYAHSGSLTVTQDFFHDRGDTTSDPAIDIELVHTNWTSGATGSITVTYPTASNTLNAMGFWLEEGAAAPVSPTVGFIWPNSTESTAIRAGFQVNNSASTKLAVSTASDMSGSVKTADVTTSDGLWHTARLTGLTPGTQYYVQLECDGVLTGPIMAVKTLKPGVPLSYKFLTGSCHSSGVNAAIFDQMATETADFFVHQGDLHYADTNVEATWRSAFVTNMNTSKFANFRTKMVMNYQYDNHDWAGQGFEADDWDPTINPRSMVKELSGEYPLSGNLYKTWVHGRVRFIHTDLWSERDDDALAESSTKRCMSAAQETQFLADLAAATEPLIIWIAHWPLYTTLPGGRWGSYTTQRDRIKAWLDARPGIRSRMIAIGGDSHSVSSDSGVNQTAFGKMPTLNASPFYAAGAAPSGTWDIVNYDVPDTEGVYSRCTITDDIKTLTFKWEAIGESGAVVSTATWTRKFVTPKVVVSGVERDSVAYVVVGGQEVLASDLTIV
jgi:hypothetical protein